MHPASIPECSHGSLSILAENEMKVNISLKVKDREELIFHTLVSAGENWYEAKNQCRDFTGRYEYR